MIQRSILGNTSLYNRVSYILTTCVDRRVLHIGCTDSPYHMERYKNKELLHIMLMDVAKELWGIDTDMESVEWLRTEHGTGNILCANIEHVGSIMDDKKKYFELVLASEVLEHLSNPGLALDSIQQYLRDDGCLLITVPNAFCIRNFLNSCLYFEKVHPDHKMWFSPRTIYQLLDMHGYITTDIFPYVTRIRRSPAGIYDSIVRLWQHLFKWTSEGLIVVARKHG